MLVPFAPSTPWRTNIWRWNSERWRALGYEPHIAEPQSFDGQPGHFDYAETVNRLVLASRAHVIVIADADSLVNRDWLKHALLLAQEGHWSMAKRYTFLSPHQTEMMLSVPATDRNVTAFPGTEWIGNSWGGVRVMPRDAFLAAGGMDERFKGWGSGDVQIGLALDALWNPHLRVGGDCFHLWHPQSLDDTYGQPGMRVQQDLTERYVAATANATAMRALVAEHASLRATA